MLFIPAHVEKFAARAHQRGADACVLDLEDSVPGAWKAQARTGLQAIAAGIAAHGVDVLVRVNAGKQDCEVDILAAVSAQVCALVLPKANSAESIQHVAALLDEVERARGLCAGHTRLLAPCQMVLFACRRHGLLPFGFPGSIGEFTDLDVLRTQIDLARECGFVGALCVHPRKSRCSTSGLPRLPGNLRRHAHRWRSARPGLRRAAAPRSFAER